MTKRHGLTRHRNRVKRPTWMKIFISLLTPLFGLGIWYLINLGIYYYLPYINSHFLQYTPLFYFIVCGLLYSGLIPILFISLWVWGKIISEEKMKGLFWRPIVLSLVVMVPIFVHYFKQAQIEVDKLPQIIAHRSLNNKNAAENTIQALQLTSQDKPDLVEIDIYETADLEFVVFHNGTLVEVANIYKRPHDLTLAELTQITFTDPSSGIEGTIPSFDAMLDEAETLGQKLLIDFKTYKADSPEMVDTFLAKYQSRLEKGHHQVQSSDAELMRKILKHSPKFETFLISNSILEHDIPGLTGYSVPLLELTDDLYSYLVINNKKIYAWTINDSQGVLNAEFLEVNAIITDYLGKTRNELEEIKKDRDYSFLYYKQLYNLFIFPMI